jgi:GMP synthase-like glutamine amidotransferase
MNAGHANQAMRCFRGIMTAFFDRVRAANPGLSCRLVEVSPRDTNLVVPRDCDIYVGSGGPGSPYDGDEEPWFKDFGDFVDWIYREADRDDEHQKSLFGVCYTFELLVRHFDVAEVSTRDSRKFGVMPIYTTGYGQKHSLLAPFRDRLFAFEHRNWEAVEMKGKNVEALGGGLLALESRDGHSKGRGLLGFDFGRGVEAVQFHPEADRAGVMLGGASGAGGGVPRHVRRRHLPGHAPDPGRPKPPRSDLRARDPRVSPAAVQQARERAWLPADRGPLGRRRGGRVRGRAPRLAGHPDLGRSVCGGQPLNLLRLRRRLDYFLHSI